MLELSDFKMHKPDKYFRKDLGPYFVSHIEDTKTRTSLLLKVYKNGDAVLSANGPFYLNETSLDKLRYQIWYGQEKWEESINTK